MNQEEFNKWKNEFLDEALTALAAHTPLTDILFFKGARILNLRLGTELRQSLDIDSNLNSTFAISHPNIQDQINFLEDQCLKALRNYFEEQTPIRYQVTSVKGSSSPRLGHPFGWDGRTIKIAVIDNKLHNVRGIPPIELEIASPEELSLNSISPLKIGDYTVSAYTLERIAGEKMRAFLSSLPAYISKIGRRTDHRRVKDLYDIARILQKHHISSEDYWLNAGKEFKLACKSRFIDCTGIQTFAANLEITKKLYNNDPSIPQNISFEEAWTSIEIIIEFLEEKGIIPFLFPIPKKIPILGNYRLSSK